MLTISYIKPAYHYDSLATQRNTTEVNPFAQKLLLKTPKEYTEQYQHAKIVQPYYNFSEQFVSLYNHDWILVVGIMLLIFMTYVKVQFSQVIKRLLTSVVNFQFAKQLVNEKSSVVQKSSWFLLTLFVISFSLFLSAFIYYINPDSAHNPYLFLLVFLFVSGFYLLKISLYFLIGYLTDNLSQTRLIMSHFSVFYRNLSLLFTPLSLVLFFIQLRFLASILIVMVLLFVIFSLMRIYRAFFLSLQMKFSYLFIFLYLCTIELIPLLYSYKILKMWV
ncbi:MAG TPA: DUF4271 domain-containing protein [Bacteroidales bacterium]|nr:DUF4271 domain-containing protein [Bacteroidales bacterium]HOU99050.1 DUF4271 domain-containing protein [Bacteroidales bacterium]